MPICNVNAQRETVMLTSEQKDMLKTIRDHGSVAPVSYRLTFAPDLQKWARDGKYVERARGEYRLTDSGIALASRI